jgi:glycosyltransferase involved in cell wall biosynthesis
MRLLIVTQKVDRDDSNLGFFHDWLMEFARQCERLTVIALETRAHALPAHVRILSLGKEEGHTRLRRLARLLRLVRSERYGYDAVLCHMSPLYVVAGGPFWKLSGKKIGLWYVHRSVTPTLRVAERLADVIITASTDSFPLPSRKTHHVGHAVNADTYRRPPSFQRASRGKVHGVSIGRITPIKKLEVLVEAAALLAETTHPFTVDLIGGPVTEADADYEAGLKKRVAERRLGNIVRFRGAVPHQDIAREYWKADFSINLCPRGLMDKVVLESLAAGTPTICSNEAFRPVLGDQAASLMFREGDPADAARVLSRFLARPDRFALADRLADRIAQDFGLHALIRRILALLS